MTDNDQSSTTDTTTEQQGIDAGEVEQAVERVEDSEADGAAEPSLRERVGNARGDVVDGLSEKFLDARDSNSDDEHEVRPPETDDDDFAAKTTSAVENFVEMVKRLVVVPLVAILKYVPRSDVLGGMLIRVGLAKKVELSRGDGIIFVLYGDGALIPQTYTIDSQRKKYITENGGEYSYDAEGHQTWQFGGVPIAFAVKGIPEVLEPAQTYLARQMRQNMKVDVPAMDDNGNQIGYERYVPVTTSDGEDGLLVNFRSAIETFGQKITEDDLQDQYEKGFLKAVDGRTGKDKMMWAIMGLAAGVGGTVVIQWVTSKIGSGGGGGGIIPLAIDAGGLFL